MTHPDEESPILAFEGNQTPATSTYLNSPAKGSHSPPRAVPPRNVELDVLRGTMALLVVSHHFHWIFERFKCHGFWTESVCTIFFHGKFSVMVFYGLSGAVLLKKFMFTKDVEDLKHSVFKRVPRLSVPVFVATLTACLFANCGAFDELHLLAEITGSKWCGSLEEGFCWTRDWRRAVLDAFPPYPSQGGAFPAGVLWTLQYELLGSCYLFLLAPLLLYIVDGNFSWPGAGERKYPLDHNAQFALVGRCLGTHGLFLGFLAFLSSYQRRNPAPFVPIEKWLHLKVDNHGWGQLWRTLFLFQAGLALEHLGSTINSFPLRSSFRSASAFFSRWFLFSLLIIAGWSVIIYVPRPIQQLIDAGTMNEPDYAAFGAILVVAAVLVMPDDLALWCLRVRIIGDISFGVYLCHGIVLFTFAVPLYITLRVHHYGLVFCYVATLAFSLPPILLVAYAFYKLVEKPYAIDGPRRLYDYLFHPKST